MATPIRTLLFSTLYPSSARLSHGIFVETRLRHLLSSGEVETRVIAPVPWFPFRHDAFGDYARQAAVPRRETRNGLQVDHPRYLLLPKIGMNSAPKTLARAGLQAARRLLASGYDFDLIDAHYFYPDGVAAVMIGRVLNKPVVITARGTDINLIPQFRKPRRMILEAAKECAAMITVCGALKDELVALGGAAGKITVLRNGVDLDLFHPEDRDGARKEFNMGSGFAIASVGHLIERKGHHLAIEALADIPDADLFIAGSGEEDGRLRALAGKLGVAGRVHFLGAMPQARLRTLYNAADCLVLASSREGWANVLLEAMACGTPVVATAVGGIPDVVKDAETGFILPNNTPETIAEGIIRALSHPSLPQIIQDARRLIEREYSYEPTLKRWGRVLSALR